MFLVMAIGSRPKHEIASCRDGWGERSYPRKATAIVDRTPNLLIEARALPLSHSRRHH